MSGPETTDRDERIRQILNDYLDRRARGCAEPVERLRAGHADLADDRSALTRFTREAQAGGELAWLSP